MRSILLIAIVALVAAASATAQPRTVTFQGRARDAAGSFPDDQRRVTIRLFDVPSGGSALFSEQHDVRFNAGSFTIVIGGTTGTGIPETITFEGPMWLELTIAGFNGGAPLQPRMRFHSAPSAISAITAQSAAIADEANHALRADGLVDGASITVDSIVVREPAPTKPSAATLYSDNIPLAWALVASDGSILADVGVESVTRTGRGQYSVVLDNAAETVTDPKLGTMPAMAPMIMPTLLTDIGQPISVAWSFVAGTPTASRQIAVQTYVSPNGTPTASDAGFSIVVYGRAAR